MTQTELPIDYGYFPDAIRIDMVKACRDLHGDWIADRLNYFIATNRGRWRYAWQVKAEIDKELKRLQRLKESI